MYGWVSEPAPWALPLGTWPGKVPFPRTQTSLQVLVLWGHSRTIWKPIDQPNINFNTDFLFLTKMQKFLGVQNARNDGAQRILDFGCFALNRPMLKSNSKTILC